MASEVMSALSGMIPSFTGGEIANFIGIFLLIIFLGILLAFVGVYVINLLKYNKRVKLFRKIGNNIELAFVDRAMFARVGIAGDYWCKLHKAKKILPRPRIQMERNTYWFYEREDGEWINFSLEDIDKKIGKVNLVDEDMRLQRLGIQKNLNERFMKVTFWQRYGGMIISIIYVLIVTICFVVLFREMDGAWAGAATMAEAVRDMAVDVRNLGLQTGSGVVAVGGFVMSGSFNFKKRLKKWFK